jgi:hypothetical protein
VLGLRETGGTGESGKHQDHDVRGSGAVHFGSDGHIRVRAGSENVAAFFARIALPTNAHPAPPRKCIVGGRGRHGEEISWFSMRHGYSLLARRGQSVVSLSTNLRPLADNTCDMLAASQHLVRMLTPWRNPRSSQQENIPLQSCRRGVHCWRHSLPRSA